MNKQTKIGVVVGIIIAMFLMVWLFSSGENAAKEKRAKFVSSNWSTRFQVDDKKPMGLYLLTALTQAHLDTNHQIAIVTPTTDLDSIFEKDTSKKTFFFVGNNFGLQSSEMDTLLSEVKKGSSLFLSFNDLTENLFSKLFYEYHTKFEYNDHVNVFSDKHKYKMINLFQNDTIATDWKAFHKIESLGPHKSLSSFMEMSNFIKVKHGDGFLFFHSNPEMFYNYQLKRLPGFKYAEFTLNQLPKDQDVYLLELGRLTDNFGNHDVDDDSGADGKVDDSYFKLIFQNPTLLTALLLSILGILLFIVFRSKRTEPVVPYIGKKKDMTLAFTETITSIYFAKRHPYGLLQVQRKNFYATIQKHFFIDLNRGSDDKVLDVLAEKCNMERSEINQMVNLLETKEASQISDQYITDVNKKMHAFYRKIGVISDKLHEKMQAREMVFRRAMLLPILFVFSGVSLFIFGVYYLMSSIGVGIVFWPIGILLIILGILRMSNPYMKVNANTIEYYSAFGKKYSFDKEDLISSELKTKGAILNFRENKQLIINYWDLSRFDQKQFKRFVSKFHNLEL